MRLTRLEREDKRKMKRENEGKGKEGLLRVRKKRKRGILGGFLGVAKEKRRDDDEGYHKPHHTFFTLLSFIVLFTSRAFHTYSQSELPLSFLSAPPPSFLFHLINTSNIHYHSNILTYCPCIIPFSLSLFTACTDLFLLIYSSIFSALT